MTERVRGLAWFVGSAVMLLAVWQIYAVSGAANRLLPAPSTVVAAAAAALAHPFYMNGPNDIGVGWHLLWSLGRVALGFTLAAAVAIPAGLAIGLSPVAALALDPYIQLLRPISPLAWLPIGLALFRSSDVTAIFVIAISSLWPIVLNTIFGVREIDPTYIDVGRSLGASRTTMLRKIIIPAAAPSIVGGLRIGVGIAWLVIIAAEMLVGGSGLGYYVWNEWNDLKMASIITAIALIGGVGLVLDRAFAALQRRVSYR